MNLKSVSKMLKAAGISKSCRFPAMVIQVMDGNKDGKINKKEFTGFVKLYLESKSEL